MRNPITLTAVLLLAGFSLQAYSPVCAQSYGTSSYGIPIPGVGTKIDYVGDDFEADEWKFVHNMPKSSRELNERSYGPMAYSTNRRWAEGPERGQPDVLKVIPTPSNGLPGSTKALQISTLRSGIPGRNTNVAIREDWKGNWTLLCLANPACRAWHRLVLNGVTTRTCYGMA